MYVIRVRYLKRNGRPCYRVHYEEDQDFAKGYLQQIGMRITSGMGVTGRVNSVKITGPNGWGVRVYRERKAFVKFPGFRWARCNAAALCGCMVLDWDVMSRQSFFGAPALDSDAEFSFGEE
jgi:hypothetical protein